MTWAIPAIMAASAASQGASSKKSDGDSNTGTYSGDTASNMALDYYNSSQGIRGETNKDLYNFLIGDHDPTGSPVFRTGRKTIEDQYDVAKENVISAMPEGGQLTDKLADVEMGRANAIGGLAGSVSEDMFDKAYGWSTGSPQVSIGGLTNVAGSEAMLNAQDSAAKSRSMSDMGYALGHASTGSK